MAVLYNTTAIYHGRKLHLQIPFSIHICLFTRGAILLEFKSELLLEDEEDAGRQWICMP